MLALSALFLTATKLYAIIHLSHVMFRITLSSAKFEIAVPHQGGMLVLGAARTSSAD